ncbi:hypothetical protein ACS22W_25950, partial [Escherichia coli]|uniref:hypothetical protein n=1 Tax=Escherichia coli TaxID=562 RepID=UPI003F271206
EPFVCIQRASGDDSARALSLADYAGRAHATFALEVNFAASLEQSYLDEHNLKHFNRIITSEFTLLPLIVSQSDCVALVPRSIANLAA